MEFLSNVISSNMELGAWEIAKLFFFVVVFFLLLNLIKQTSIHEHYFKKYSICWEVKTFLKFIVVS